MKKQWKNGLRYVPSVSVTPSRWIPAIFGLFFYAYLLVISIRVTRLVEMMASRSTEDNFGAVVSLLGLLFFYAGSTWPRVFERRLSHTKWRGMMQRLEANRLAVVGAFLFLALVATSFLAPFLAPFDPVAQLDPATEQYQSPSTRHLMGTDRFGRDILSRVLYGSRVSLTIGVFAVSIASLIGLVLGAFAGYTGGWVDDLTMRVVDGFLAFPRLLLVLTLIAFFSGSLWLIVCLLAATGWMRVARLVRAEVLSLKEREFIHAAVATGMGRARIVWKHLVPATLGPVLITATLRIGTVILFESYMSFLGLGVRPPTPSWGVMVFEGRDVLLSAWWVSAFPGLAIVLSVVACNLLGDGLRDAVGSKNA